MSRAINSVASVTPFIAAFSLLIAVYVGAYIAMLDGKDMRATAARDDLKDLHLAYFPNCRVKLDCVEFTFGPAHSVDRLVRWRYWTDPKGGVI